MGIFDNWKVSYIDSNFHTWLLKNYLIGKTRFNSAKLFPIFWQVLGG